MRAAAGSADEQKTAHSPSFGEAGDYFRYDRKGLSAVLLDGDRSLF